MIIAGVIACVLLVLLTLIIARKKEKEYARCIKADGSIGHIEVGRDNEGVRPGVWLKTDAWVLLGGSGSRTDPYVLGSR